MVFSSSDKDKNIVPGLTSSSCCFSERQKPAMTAASETRSQESQQGDGKDERAFEDDLKVAQLKTPWKSIYACGLTMFVQTAQLFIYISSIWPYLKSRDNTLSESVVGYIFGGYNVAQCLATVAFGYLYNRVGQIRLPLLIGFSLATIGNIMYSGVDLLPAGSITAPMLTAWIIFGIGTGNGALLRTFAVTVAQPKDRSKAVSIVEFGMGIGAVLGPALQLALSPLGTEGFMLGVYRLNIYTAPALLATTFSIFGLIFIAFAFKEQGKNTVRPKEQKYTQLKEENKVPLDKLAVFICMATRITQVMAYSALQTLLSPYSMMMWSYTEEQSVKHNSVVIFGAEILGIIMLILFVFKKIKISNERVTCFVCMLSFLVLFVATYAYPFLPSKVEIASKGHVAGCDLSRYWWCDGLTAVNPIVFYSLFSVVFGPVYNVISVSLITLFSKIAGSRKQGSLQTMLQLSGYVSKTIAPFLTTYLYTLAGPRLVWGVYTISVGVVILLWLIFYKRLGKTRA